MDAFFSLFPDETEKRTARFEREKSKEHDFIIADKLPRRGICVFAFLQGRQNILRIL